jgi:hypothetical protein
MTWGYGCQACDEMCYEESILTHEQKRYCSECYVKIEGAPPLPPPGPQYDYFCKQCQSCQLQFVQFVSGPKMCVDCYEEIKVGVREYDAKKNDLAS